MAAPDLPQEQLDLLAAREKALQDKNDAVARQDGSALALVKAQQQLAKDNDALTAANTALSGAQTAVVAYDAKKYAPTPIPPTPTS